MSDALIDDNMVLLNYAMDAAHDALNQSIHNKLDMHIPYI